MGPRKEIWEIPLAVFKEAIINALSHRDYYEMGAVTMVEIYDDRVEISNPGGLLLAVKKQFGTRSLSRNPLIFGLFTRMNLVEQVASGIPRMRNEMKKSGLPEPVFTIDGGFFSVTFKRPNNNGSVNDTVDDTVNDTVNLEDAIFEIVKSKEGLSAPAIAKIIGKSVITVKRNLGTLKRDGKIEFCGAPKTGGYYLTRF